MLNVLGSNYFCGHQVSEYGLKNNRLDYGTLARSFDAVLNNSIMEATTSAGYYWEMESGAVNNDDAIAELENRIEELEERITNESSEEEDNKNNEEIKKLQEEIEELREEAEESYYPEVFQTYIVSRSGADLLKELNEVVYYNYDLDMFVWCVTHYGTSWDYVLTSVKLHEE